MTTSSEIAATAAEEVFRVIERERMINKGQITEAIEKVLLRHQPTQYTLLGSPPSHTHTVTTAYPYPYGYMGQISGSGIASNGGTVTVYRDAQGNYVHQGAEAAYSCCLLNPCICNHHK